VLRNHGVPEQQIVVMMYDDIANDQSNPFPGKLFNEPHGRDVYAGVPKDYTGQDVTPENFLSILQGKKMSVGSRKTIHSKSTDHVFVYFTDHGATGLIAFPDSVLQVDDLNKALVAMNKAKKYQKLVFYLEACESGSMFRNILPSNINIYAMTASSYDESSWGCYCDNDMNLPCLGDLFSVVWMQDSDKEDLTRETLQTQFDITKKQTNKSHVQEYGDLTWMSEPVGDFQGEDKAPSLRMWRPRAPLTGLVNSRDIPLYQLQRQLRRSVLTSERNNLTKQIVRMKQGRSYIDNVIRTLVEHLISDPELQDIVLTVHPERLTQLTCHKRVTQAFDQHCFNLAHNTYTLKHVFILANLCESGLDVGDIIDTMVVQCGSLEHKPNNVE